MRLQIANKLARRINFMYQEDARSRAKHADFTDKESQYVALGSATNQLNSKQDPFGMVPGEIAKATKECVINVRVPMGYRFDHERFLIVAANTPLEAKDPNLPRYRQRLQKMLLDARVVAFIAAGDAALEVGKEVHCRLMIVGCRLY